MSKPWLQGTVVKIEKDYSSNNVENNNHSTSEFIAASSSIPVPVRYIIFPSVFPPWNWYNNINNEDSKLLKHKTNTKNRNGSLWLNNDKSKYELIIASNDDDFHQDFDDNDDACLNNMHFSYSTNTNNDNNHKLVHLNSSSYRRRQQQQKSYLFNAALPVVPLLGSRVWYTESDSISIYGKRGCIEAVMTTNEDRLLNDQFDGNIRTGVIVGIDYSHHIIKVCDHPNFLSLWNENDSLLEDIQSNRKEYGNELPFLLDVSENKF